MTADQGGNTVTLRELFAQTANVRSTLEADIRALDTKLTGKIEQMQAHVDAALVAHNAEHKEHDTRHDNDHKARSSLIRWAVTSVLSGVGVLAAVIFGVLAFVNSRG
jgi:hypothetical protein